MKYLILTLSILFTSPVFSLNFQTPYVYVKCNFCSEQAMKQAALDKINKSGIQEVIAYSLSDASSHGFRVFVEKNFEYGFEMTTKSATAIDLPVSFSSDLYDYVTLLQKLDDVGTIEIPGSITGSAYSLIDNVILTATVSNYIRLHPSVRVELDSIMDIAEEALWVLLGDPATIRVCFEDGTCMDFTFVSALVSDLPFAPNWESISDEDNNSFDIGSIFDGTQDIGISANGGGGYLTCDEIWDFIGPDGNGGIETFSWCASYSYIP